MQDIGDHEIAEDEHIMPVASSPAKQTMEPTDVQMNVTASSPAKDV